VRRIKNESMGDYMRKIRIIQYIFVDAVCIVFTYSLTFLALKFDGASNFDIETAFKVLPLVLVFKLVAFYLMKVYRLVMDNAGIEEVFRIFIAVITTNIVITLASLFIPNYNFIPEVSMIFTTAFEGIILSVPRVIKRLTNLVSRKHPVGGKRTLLVGAGAGGKLVLNEIRNNPELNNVPIAFVDDDPLKIGKIMSGCPILGPIDKIPKFIDIYQIEEVIICIANIDPKWFQEIIQTAAERPVRIKRIPKFKELKKDTPKKFLEINVEDLLSRDVVELDSSGISEFISGKRVIVTGAGGSIGSELVRQIVDMRPSELLMLDIYENGVYDIQMELNHKYATSDEEPVQRKVLIGSVYNYNRMNAIFSAFKPQLIFHAAAYKHVPLMEDSPIEAVRTNVIGTYNICKLASLYNVEKVVLVSSDKAVRPTNVMGATKRFAEMIMQYFNSVSSTKYSAVRFGNVLGSNGSVVPLFKKQIENGGPLTVTDERIIRYFMTIPEAVGLILQSGTFAKGGEIFILDMGDPVKIIDLAEKMIMLSGRRPYIDIDISITGLRPGEKMYEELLVDKTKDITKTANKKIFIDRGSEIMPIEEEIRDITGKFETLNSVEIKEMIKSMVSTYTPK